MFADGVELRDERVRGLRLADHLEVIRACRSANGGPYTLHCRAVQAEGVALHDGLVAQIEAAQPSSLVAGQVFRSGRQEGDSPRAQLAVVDEFVQHQIQRSRGADRIAGGEGEPTEVGVGHESFAVGAEEEALVIAQREVGQRVRSVEPDQAAGARPVRLGMRRAPSNGPKEQERKPDHADDPQHQQRCGEVVAEEAPVVGDGTADANESPGDGLQAAEEGELLTEMLALDAQAGEADAKDHDDVQRPDPEQPQKRRRVGPGPKVAPVVRAGPPSWPRCRRQRSDAGP